jgi:type IV secretory pathway VirB9-like protein
VTRFSIALLAATFLTAPAFAASDPAVAKGSNDTRIRVVEYSDWTVTRIVSTNLVPITITFGSDEKPSMISGVKVIDMTPKETANAKDADVPHCVDWCADREANELTLQPLHPDPGSMLLVTTMRPSDDPARPTAHHYAYQLSTRDGVITDSKDVDFHVGKDGRPVSGDPDAYFRVTYTYPAEELAKRQADWKAAHKDDAVNAQKKKIQDQLELAQFGGPRNFQWTHGDSPDCRVLSPSRVSDNKQFTTLYFPMNAPVSIANKVNPDGSESLLSWHPERAPGGGDLMVLESVPMKFVLRRDKMVCLFERGPDNTNDAVPTTGTSSPSVIRETRR